MKREILRHLLAALVFRARVAVSNAPPDFAAFKLDHAIRTPAEILAHLGDLLHGSLYLMKGELIYLNSAPLAWDAELARFFAAAKAFDALLASDAPLAQPIEKIVQGPIADAFTHVGQLVLLRRAAGSPVQAESYFAAEIVAGELDA
ncbi:MAG TPA: hypothetical protein VIL74_03900 [Pyrinomonadaceae bacterium]|jgi:hypothetical protein